jgi:putative intracellular protease/amidase
MKILIVLTSHDKLGDSGKKTGFWLEEFTTPYYALKDAGAEVALASPKGGQPPMDPLSDLPERATLSTERFHADRAAQAELASTKPLADVSANNIDAVFYPVGHGPMWDMPNNTAFIALIEALIKDDKPVAAICHGPIALVNVRGKDCDYLVRGKHVAGFSNDEEDTGGLTKFVPYLLEDMLRERGAIYSKTEKYTPHIQVDGRLITGQNPASASSAAEALLKLLRAA